MYSECDKAFTRSDALVKHLRTVHDTDSVRSADPVLKTQSQSVVKPPKIKLTFKKGQTITNGHDPDEEIDQGAENGSYSYPADLNFTDEEMSMPPEQLFRLLRRQVHWSTQEGESLKKECSELEAERKKEWINKELLLANVVEAELASAVHSNQNTEEDNVWEMVIELLPADMMPVSGQAPWYRKAPTGVQ